MLSFHNQTLVLNNSTVNGGDGIGHKVAYVFVKYSKADGAGLAEILFQAGVIPVGPVGASLGLPPSASLISMPNIAAIVVARAGTVFQPEFPHRVTTKRQERGRMPESVFAC